MPRNAVQDEDAPATGTATVTISGGDVADPVTLVPINPGDWPVCIVALELLQGAIKRCRRAMRLIAVSDPMVDQRDGECATMLERFKTGSPFIQLGINIDWVPTLRAGIALEYEHALTLEKSQDQLQLDTGDTSSRIRQLARILDALDMAALGAKASD